MRIKKFVGPDIKSVTQQMKNELGPDAIVLNTHRVSKGGVLGVLGKELIEITAAIDEQVDLQHSTYSPGGSRDADGRHARSFEALLKNTGLQVPTGNVRGESHQTVDGLRKVAEHFEKRHTESSKLIPPQAREAAEYYHLKSEVEDIKSTVTEIAHTLRFSQTPALPDHLKRAYVDLIEQDVSEESATRLTDAVFKSVPPGHLDRKEIIDRRLIETIAALVKTGAPPRHKTKRSRVVALVGPTGAGKTTTIAKLAAIEKFLNSARVGLITVDTFRIGAIEQLRTFASIADIPMEVVYRPSEMSAALKKFSDKDVILVDTVGRSQRSSKDLTELRKFVEAAKPDEVHLVLSASTGARTLLEIVEKFKVLRPNNIIFSKIDEAVTFGPLFNIAQKANVNVSYLTTGQGVPDDIVVADGIKFASLVYQGALAHA
ncbi:MAG: flagellar biosynthesis protein FlhF [Ignavibacteriales bacterium]|nr:flagellar biosynthesis protein FlhF [Ignavibacteriales bacterium]